MTPIARETVADVGYGGGRLGTVDGNAHHFRSGAGKFGDLADGAVDVGCIGVGHRLHDDGMAAADHDGASSVADAHRHGLAARRRAGGHWSGAGEPGLKRVCPLGQGGGNRQGGVHGALRGVGLAQK